jgi:hypothetical protein
MTTCQTAANEFLRQFWSATYPPPAEFQAVAVSTPAQRAAKAAKMIGYISKTHEKVQAIVQVAQQHGIDPSRVETVSISVMIGFGDLNLCSRRCNRSSWRLTMHLPFIVTKNLPEYNL